MENYTYKESGIEWLGEIPEHWKIDRLKDCLIINDKALSSNTDSEFSINYLDIGNVDSGGIVDYSNIKRIKFGEAPSRARRLVKTCDTIISSVRTNLQAVAYIDFKKENLICSTGFFVCRPMHESMLYNKYLYYLLLSDYSKHFFSSRSVGVSYPAIDEHKFGKLNIPLPRYNEQKAIADYLDLACQKIDRVIEKKEKQIEKIEKIRKYRIDEIVRFGLQVNTDVNSTGINYLPKIKKGWDIDRFKDVAMLRKEKTDKRSEEIDYIELEDIEQKTGRLLSKKDTSEVESRVTLFQTGDVLFGKLRPYLEKYHFAEFDGKCTGEILAFKPMRINNKFLMYLVASKWFIDLCNSMSYGAKMPRVNWPKQLSQTNLPLPFEEEQQEIVSYLDDLSNKIFETVENIHNQIKTLKKYRKSLIHECVTGKKNVVEDSTDQAAENAMAISSA